MITRLGHRKEISGALGPSCNPRRGRVTDIRQQRTVYFGIGSMITLKRGVVQMAMRSTSSSSKR